MLAFRILDEPLLTLFQRISDRLHDWTGRNCFFWAYVCLGINASGALIDRIFIQKSILSAIWCIAGSAFWLLGVSRLEETTPCTTRLGLTWVAKNLIALLVRLLLAWFFVVNSLAGLNELVRDVFVYTRFNIIFESGTLTAVAYFVSCRPKPPREEPDIIYSHA
jgi:hypothetical protein